MLKRGITFLSIMVAVVALAIITATLVISVPNVLQSSKLRAFASELMMVQTKIQSLNGNYSEYVINDIVVDISDLTDKSMFNGIVIDNKVSLQQLNLEALGFANTVYGNAKTPKDIYCISPENGVVYYLEGFETPDAKYYALNADLVNMVSTREDLTSNVGTNIIFIPSTFVKTTDAIKVTVKVPAVATNITISGSGDITPAVSGPTTAGNYNQYVVNTSSVKGNYTVTVSYTINGKNNQAKYTVDQYYVYGVYAVLYSDGELRINNDRRLDEHKLKEGCTVVLQSADITNSTTIPWSSQKTSIKKVSFENKVTPTYIKSWFNGCTNLTEVNNIEYLDTSNVTNMEFMFQNCKKLIEIDIGCFDASKVTNMYAMFKGCSNLENLNMTGFKTSPTNRVNVEEAFWDCNKVNEIDFSGISYVGSMYGTFRGCRALSTLDLNHVKGVTHLGGAFMDCRNLVTLRAENMDISNNVNLSYTFSNCKNLEELDVSKWNTEKVRSMYRIFAGCTKLKQLDLNSWNILNVTNLNVAFQNCSALENVYISNWNTKNVTAMEFMFESCLALKEIDMTNWNVSSLTTVEGMFYGCYNLKTVKANNWGTNKITTMLNMFVNCHKLETVYLNNVITTSVTNMTQMFYPCSNLKNMYMNKATFNQVTSYSKMFNSSATGTMVVADETAKTWIQARLAEAGSTSAVVKTVAET